ncbi:purine nucleoside phosphorylase LACC1 [Pempheris klunzingeri]|uniref:purine nucleoside phosphorylase LACC1 n=1 Tax=Pempheris klunzingeri TaxID=3127111 RepID=UPI00397FDC06
MTPGGPRGLRAQLEEAGRSRVSRPGQGFPEGAEPGCGRPARKWRLRLPHALSSSPRQSAMCEAVLLDLLHGCCRPAGPGGSVLPEEAAANPASAPQLFLLRGKHRGEDASLTRAPPGSCGREPHELTGGSTAECLFRFKRSLDDLDLTSVRVLTSPRGRAVLRAYQRLLFTAAYTFDYRLTTEHCLTCPSLAGPAHPDSPGAGVHEEEEGGEEEEEDVSSFLQQLPAVRGEMTTLQSPLIPDCFGHGFSTRTGGVSYLPTLSSLNLFCSSRRRDPGAVVLENRRRLAVHAGFHPRPLLMVKVDHGRDVWVVGKAEPPSYDAVVTNQTGLVLAAPGADCMPILFADPGSKVIGAAHAGYKGTLMGVAMATVEAMVREFGCQVSDIVVAVGPSVGACCFTLEKNQALLFQSIHPDCVPDPESTRPHVNIRLANRVLLQNGGVRPENIHDDSVTERPCVTPCTSCHPEAFFSHVRDGPNFGTQVGFLWIREPGGPSDRKPQVETPETDHM